MLEVHVSSPSEPGYQVTSEGRVWSDRSSRYLKASPDSHGYLRVTVNGHTRLVHVLVAEAFLGPRPERLHVCHGREGQTVNTVLNLRYDTQIENERDKRDRRKKGKRKRREGRS